MGYYWQLDRQYLIFLLLSSSVSVDTERLASPDSAERGGIRKRRFSVILTGGAYVRGELSSKADKERETAPHQ